MTRADCLAAVRHWLSVALGFVREHAPESSTRLVMILFSLTACVEAHRIVSFAFAHPDAHLTVGELAGIVGILVGTGCVGMALRTRSADSAAAKAEQMAAEVTAKLAGGVP